jgi:5-methylthioadenosine/S-adenosylhomocysteine deaminase
MGFPEGDPHGQSYLLVMRPVIRVGSARRARRGRSCRHVWGARVSVSLSSDATSITPPNMFEMMRLTWNLGVPWKNTENEAENPVGVHEVIEMATINGAKALGLGGVTGSLTEGKRADIILIRTKDINVAPVGNIETAVVQTTTPANVDTVIVDGRILKRSGRLTAYDVPRIIDQAEKSASDIRKKAGDLLKF